MTWQDRSIFCAMTRGGWTLCGAATAELHRETDLLSFQRAHQIPEVLNHRRRALLASLFIGSD